MAYLSFACRLLVGFLFLISGIAKLKMGSQEFARLILGYRLTNTTVSQVIGRVLPWIEIGLAIALATGIAHPIPSWAAATLLIVFSIAMVPSLLSKRKAECGCFGSKDYISWHLVIRNLLLTAITIIGIKI